jgi:hypothetical protein
MHNICNNNNRFLLEKIKNKNGWMDGATTITRNKSNIRYVIDSKLYQAFSSLILLLLVETTPTTLLLMVTTPRLLVLLFAPTRF